MLLQPCSPHFSSTTTCEPATTRRWRRGTTRRLLSWAVASIAATGIAVGCVPATNPYDAEAPLDEQQKSSVSGTVVFVRTAFDSAVMEADLNAMQVQLHDVGADEVVRTGRCVPMGATEFPMVCDAEEGTASFAFADVTPGSYQLRVVDAPADLVGAENGIAVDNLAPGESRALGAVFLRERPVDGVVGAGAIAGRVKLADQEGGRRTVTLYRRTGEGAQPFMQTATDADGQFAFDALPNGTYGVLAELDGFTPAVAVGLTVLATDEVASPSFRLDDGSPDGEALTLHPVTAVLQPNLSTEDNGAFYTSGDDVRLTVLAFAEESHLQMRVSTDPSFNDGGDAFVPFNAQVTQELPDVEGPVVIYAQFQTQHPEYDEFVFTTSLFTTEVVRDTQPPEVIDVAIRNYDVDAEGRVWVTQEGAAVGLDVLAVDEVSSVARAQVHIQDDNGAGDASVLAGADVDSPSGLAQLQMTSTVTAGDGEKVLWVWLADQAGNTADPFAVTVHVDTAPPVLGDAATSTPALVVDNVDGAGVLAGREAQVRFHVPDGLDVADQPVQMRLGQDSIATNAAFGVFDGDTVVDVRGTNGASFQFVADVADRAGNVVRVESATYTLDLSGTVRGRALVDQQDAAQPVHGSIVVRLYHADDDIGVDPALDETLTDALGAFAFGGVPEGSGYRLVLERPGLVTTEIGVGQVIAGGVTSLSTTRLPFARGNLTGIFQLEDKVDDVSAHGGILVAAVRDGEVMAQTVTEPDGRYTFPLPGVPVTVDAQRYEVRASVEAYFSASEPGLQVQQNTTTVVRETSAGSSTPAPVMLKPISGDFVLCAVGADPCEQTPYTNADDVRVYLEEDADVTEVRVQARTAFDTADADPAWVPYDAVTPVVVDISGADGVVEVFVQLRRGAITGRVLSATIVRDTTAPTVVSLLASSTVDEAVGAFTHRPEAAVRLTATAGDGEVSPLSSAHLSWGATPPASIPVGAALCAANAECLLQLEGGAAAVEGQHDVHGFVCDQAGNCTDTPLSASIVYDVTPPLQLHGVTTTPTGAGVVEDAGAYYSTVAQYFVDLGVGTARTAMGQPVLDVDGDAVSDVAAYRFLPVFVGEAAPPAGVDFATTPFVNVPVGTTAGGTVDHIVAPGLAGNDGRYRVFAQFRDAAGNVSPADNNPFFFDLTLDTTPPNVALRIDADAAYTQTSAVTLSWSAPATDAPIRVWLSKDEGRFDDFDVVELSGDAGDLPFDLQTLSTFTGDGTYVVYARFFDAAGNAVDRSDSIVLDATAPQASPLRCSTCVVDNATVLSNSRNITLEMFASDVGSGVVQTRTSIAGGPAVNEGYALTRQVTLPDSDGPHIVAVQYVDGAGNASAAQQMVVVLDRTPPVITSFDISGADSHTRNTTVMLALSATDAADMRFSNSAVFDTAFAPYAPQASWPLASPAVDETKEVFVEVRDAAGNVASASDTIVLDTTAPSGVLVIDGGAVSTSNTSPPATLTFPNDTVAYGVHDGIVGCSGASTPTGVTLGDTTASLTLSLAGADGLKQKTVCLRDVAGNFGVATASILLDTTAPTGTVQVASGDAFTQTALVDVQLSASDDVTDVALGEGTLDCATASYQTFEPNKQYAIVGGDGPVEVIACLRDTVGLTYSVSDTVVLDRVAPTVGLVVQGGATHTSTAQVSVEVSASADVVEMALANAGSLDCATASYTRYTAAQLFSLTGADGSRPVSVCVRDGAGWEASTSTSIVLDTAAPTASLTLDGGASRTAASSVPVALSASESVAVVFGEGIDCASAVYGALAGTTPSSTVALNGDGVHVVTACFQDVAGHIGVATADIVLDTTGPSATLTLTSSSPTASTTVNVAFVGADADASSLLLSTSAVDCDAAAAGAFSAFSTTASIGLSGADGTHTVTACLRDDLDNRRNVGSVSVLLDRVAPTATTTFDASVRDGSFTKTAGAGLVIASGATHNDPLPRFTWSAFTDSTGVTYDVEVSSVASFTAPEFTFGAIGAGLAVPPSALPDGLWYWRVVGEDQAGNTSSTATKTFTVDTTAPDAPTLQELPSVTNTHVLVSWDAPAGASSYDVTVHDGASDVVSTTTTGTSLLVTAGGDMPSANGQRYTVRVQATDAVGNESAVTLGSWLFDDQAPCASGAVVVLSGTDGVGTYSSTEVVPTTITCAGEAPVDFQLACDGTLDSEPVVPFAESTQCSLSGGSNTVRAQVFDEAGNGRLATADSITVDTAPPSIPRFAADSTTTSSATFTVPALAVTSTDSGASGLLSGQTYATPYELYAPQIASDCAPANLRPNGWCGWAGSSSFDVTLIEGENRIRVRAVDNARNVGDDDQLIVIKDTSGPTAVQNLDADAGNGEVTITWDPPADASDVEGYLVYYGPSYSSTLAGYTMANANEGMSPIDVGLNTSFRLTGLPLGAKLYVGVRAYDKVNLGAAAALNRDLRPNEVTPRTLSASNFTEWGDSVPRAVKHRDGIAYVAHGCLAATSCTGDGFSSVDISDPENPVVLDTVANFPRSIDFAILGQYAYIADGSYVRIVDISDPHNLSHESNIYVSSLNSQTWAVSVAVTPGWLFVSCERNGVRIYRLTGAGSPSSPSYATSFNPSGIFNGSTVDSGAGALTVQGDYLYVTERDYRDGNDVVVVDITTPSSPTHAGTIDTSVPFWDVEVSGRYLYGTRNGAFEVYRMSDTGSGSTTVTGTLEATTPAQPVAMALAGPYAYVANEDSFSGNVALDVYALREVGDANATIPLVGQEALSSFGKENALTDFYPSGTRNNSIITNPSRLAVAGMYLLEANRTDGLVIRRLNQPFDASEINNVEIEPNLNAGSLGIEHYGTNLVFSRGAQLSFLDVTEPQDPVWGNVVGSYQGSVSGVQVRGDRAYVAGRDGLRVFAINMSTTSGKPVTATLEATWTESTIVGSGGTYYPQRVHVNWPYAYVLAGEDSYYAEDARLYEIDLRTMTRIDLVNIGNPNTVGTSAMAYYRDRLYITTPGRFSVVNVAGTNIYTQANLATIPTGVSIQGDRMVTGGSQVRTWDLSTNRDNPSVVGLGSASGNHVTVSGDYVFSADGPSPIITDILDPTSPSTVMFAGSLSYAQGVTVIGKHLFAMDREHLSIIELQ